MNISAESLLKYWAFADRVLFLEYSRLDKQNMSFPRNGVRIWNKLANEILQMPKEKFKRNINNMLLQKLSDMSEANEYIDLLQDLNMPCMKTELNSFYLHYPSSSVICLILLWVFVFPKCYTGQYSVFSLFNVLYDNN